MADEQERKTERARRGRGEGSVFRHKRDGCWIARWSEGGRRREFTGKTKKEALDKMRTARNRGLPAEVSRVTVEQYLLTWLGSCNVQPTTHRRYKQVVDLRLIPKLGGRRLAELRPVHVKQMYVDLEKDGESARARQMAGVVLGTALREAVQLELIDHNPAAEVRKPRPTEKEMQVWDAEQAASFLRVVAPERLAAMFILALATGMRARELYGLQWADIDLGSGSLSVRRTLQEVGKDYRKGDEPIFRLKAPKSGKTRKVALPQFAVEALEAHRQKMLAEGLPVVGPATVFCERSGGFLWHRNMVRRFKTLCAKAKVPALPFHSMRHCNATLLLQKGESLKVVQERLGHSRPEVTLRFYAHVLPGMQQGAADRLDATLGGDKVG